MVKPPYQNLSPADQDRLAATGFLRTAPDGTGDPEAEALTARNDVVAETVKVVSSSFLGLTVGCAQCHAHRYDPIAQEDYYRIRALFEPALDPSNWRAPSGRLISLWGEAERKQAAKVDAEVAKVESRRAAAVKELVQKVLEAELAVAPEALRPKLREARDVPPRKRTPEQSKLLKDYPRVLVTLGNVSLYDARAFNQITAKFAKESAKAREGGRPRITWPC
ncbi:MAG: DUF1549 domain-containing protein [Isosphaeraceae bacterium]